MSRAAPFLALAALLPAPALFALQFRDGPPARVTGGFGEDSCVACHFGNAVNDPSGRLTIAGFPERYEPGATYELELTLARDSAFSAAGFQLAVRLADGLTQAGMIEVSAANQARIGLINERGIRFAHHRLAEAAQSATNTASWKLSWTAPEAAGTVWIHAAAVAADRDESQLGDHVYTTCKAAEPDGDLSFRQAALPPT